MNSPCNLFYLFMLEQPSSQIHKVGNKLCNTYASLECVNIVLGTLIVTTTLEKFFCLSGTFLHSDKIISREVPRNIIFASREVPRNISGRGANTSQKHSKVMEVKHNKLEMQPYLLPSENEMFQEEINTIFKLRCRVTKVKMNMKSLYETYECTACKNEDES